MKNKPIGYLVAYDSGDYGPLPMGADDDCAGAIEAMSDSVVMFPTRELAKRAIEISRLNALLRQQHGKSVNTDFTSDRKNLRVVPVFAAVVPSKTEVNG